MAKNICKLAILISAFLIMNYYVFAQGEAPKAQSEWLHNQDHDFWVKKPVGWDRAEKGLTGDLAEELISPKRDAFVEIYAAKMPGYMTSELLANGWDESMGRKLKFLQKRISSEQVNVDGASGILRLYQSGRKGEMLKTYALYLYKGGKTFVAVGIFPESLAVDYEAAVKESVLSFRLVSP